MKTSVWHGKLGQMIIVRKESVETVDDIERLLTEVNRISSRIIRERV